MINTSINQHSLKQAMTILRNLKKQMNIVQEQNNPYLHRAKEIMCIEIDEAINWLEELKMNISK